MRCERRCPPHKSRTRQRGRCVSGYSPAVLSGLFYGPHCYGKRFEGSDIRGSADEQRHDIIQAITFGSPEGVIAFCQGIQSASPVDSFVACEPAPMPGYDSDVIMAAGAFVSGSSIELSADGPIKPPYNVYFQGGLTWPHAKFGILKTLQNMKDRGLAKLDANH